MLLPDTADLLLAGHPQSYPQGVIYSGWRVKGWFSAILARTAPIPSAFDGSPFDRIVLSVLVGQYAAATGSYSYLKLTTYLLSRFGRYAGRFIQGRLA
jgi:hypothetical protein